MINFLTTNGGQFAIEPCDKENAQKIIDGINEYNLGQVAGLSEVWTPFEYIAKDEKGNILGGILAGMGYWKGLEIRILWVEQKQRRKGIGTQLLKWVEDAAIEQGARISMYLGVF